MANGGPNSHAVMKSSLAKALIDAGVKHYDLGGLISGALSPITGALQGVGSSLTTQDGYQAQLAPTTTSSYAPTITTAQNNALAVNPQQQQLATQLLNQSTGAGPNPAQTMLNQSTGQNIAAQGAAQAGQRGASSNVGLMARQIGQQGAATQQGATGQAATLNAQQQLGAETTAGTVLNQELTGSNQTLADAGTLQNAQNNTSVANTGMEQGINAGVAATNAGAANTATGGLINGAAGGAAAFLGAADGGKIEKSGDIVSPKGKAPMVLTNGGGVAGKSPHPGNDLRNDTELALLSKGEGVLPNSVMGAKDAPEKAAQFVRELQAKEGKSPEAGGYDKVASAKKSLKDRVAHLEKLCMGGAV